jgi:hypothetical protein
VQTALVVDAKVTTSPELAVAPSVIGVIPSVTLLNVANEIVCEAGFTMKLWLTGLAAGTLLFPGCVAVIEQVPAARMVTMLPATLQTAPVVEANKTVSPELAVAEIVNGATPNETLLRGPNVIVCAPWPTVKLCVTEGAAA